MGVTNHLLTRMILQVFKGCLNKVVGPWTAGWRVKNKFNQSSENVEKSSATIRMRMQKKPVFCDHVADSFNSKDHETIKTKTFNRQQLSSKTGSKDFIWIFFKTQYFWIVLFCQKKLGSPQGVAKTWQTFFQPEKTKVEKKILHPRSEGRTDDLRFWKRIRGSQTDFQHSCESFEWKQKNDDFCLLYPPWN